MICIYRVFLEMLSPLNIKVGPQPAISTKELLTYTKYIPLIVNVILGIWSFPESDEIR